MLFSSLSRDHRQVLRTGGNQCFLRPEVRQRYERAPHLLGAEVEALAPRTSANRPLVVLDEVQRVPELVNVVQDLVDRRVAKFVLMGFSAGKLRRGGGVNLLPGRLLPIRLDPLSLAERVPATLEEALLYGSLPGIALAANDVAREEDCLRPGPSAPLSTSTSHVGRRDSDA